MLATNKKKSEKFHKLQLIWLEHEQKDNFRFNAFPEIVTAFSG